MAFGLQGQVKKDLGLCRYGGAAPWRRAVTPGTTVVVVVVVVVAVVVVVVVVHIIYESFSSPPSPKRKKHHGFPVIYVFHPVS